MNYRKLGKWGVKLSEVSLGSWLTYGASVDEQHAVKLIHHAFENGINFFDTANVYAQGRAEIVVGKAISSMSRESIVLASKVFFAMGEGPNDKGLSRKHVFEQCHASLKRLNTDYIDLYQCHRFDPDVPVEELVRTMDDLTRQGKILYWGVSEWTAAQIATAVETAKALNAPPPVSNQPYYNMLGRDIELDVVPACRDLGLGQVVFSPLAQGVLSGKYKPGQKAPQESRAANNSINVFMMNRSLMSDETLERVQDLSTLAGELSVSMAQLALAWCLRLPEVTSVITGATKIEQINDNIKASGINLSNDVLKRIDMILTAEKEPV